jgi:hypothetical protein
MTEKRQTSQGYIIRILQHFATKLKLRNITNFVMLFQAVVKFLSRLVEIKILVIIGPMWHPITFINKLYAEEFQIEFIFLYCALTSFPNSPLYSLTSL